MYHINKCISENQNTSIVKHHQEVYDGHFPIWTIIDFFPVGTLSYFFRGMKNTDKTHIANSLYGVNYQTMDSWMRCLTDLRNRCAHYSRVYYWIFPALPKMPVGETYIPTRRVFAQLYMLKYMYPDKDGWNEHFLFPLIQLIEMYSPYISLKHLDFPSNWSTLLKQ